jgi:hypothetical protein
LSGQSEILALVERVRLRFAQRVRATVVSSDLTTCASDRMADTRPSNGVPREGSARGIPVPRTRDQDRTH